MYIASGTVVKEIISSNTFIVVSSIFARCYTFLVFYPNKLNTVNMCCSQLNRGAKLVLPAIKTLVG